MLFWRGKAAAILYAAIIFTVTFIAGTADVFAAVDDHTVQGKTPQGTVISLFDYWVNEQSSPDHGTSNNNSSGGINKSHSLKFSNGQGDGFNGWTGGKAPHSGMLDKTLDSSGYPSLAPDFGSWIFYSESLAYLFDDTKVEGKKAYNNVEGLMQVDDDGYYYYDSAKNFASYDEKTNSMKLYDKPAVKESSSSSKIGQFFPFDSASKVFNESSGQLVADTGVRADSSNVNHWFGLTMSTHFLHPADGKTTRGQDITYEFSGDDDVWVFIDDVLVGDLGGIHDKADLNINFSTGAVAINGESDGTIKSKFEEAGKAGDIDWTGNTFSGGTYHTLRFFYLERGNYASNMSLKFNLKLMPDSEAAKVDQYENPLEGATFSLYEAERTENDGKIEYSAKGESLCTGTTDINGSLKLKAADGATINFEELYKKNKGPYYILKETKAPAGYNKAVDVWLKYDPKTGAVTTENMWESGIQANPRIMVTAPTYMYDRFGNRIEMNSDGSLKQGSIFAIVYKRDDMDADFGDDSNWSSVSGSVLDGWQLHEADTIEGALDGNRYELKLNSMGAYETTLDELPGDIMTYSKVIVADNRGSSVEELAAALQEKAKYSILFYYTTGDINSADSSNTVRLDTGIMSQNSSVRGFEYQYAVKLVATDISNDLYVRKFDEYSTTFNSQKHSVSGVRFALYSEDQTTLLSGLRGDVKLRDDAVPVQEQTTRDIINLYGSANLYGTAVFKKLENGTYYLKEVSAPSGYKVKDELIKVVVNDDGAFADAGEKDDGIYVGRGGLGTLLNSMEQFANNNDIDTTLTNMKLNLRVSESEPAGDGSWKDSKIIHADPLHIKYTEVGEESHAGRYKVQNKDGSLDEFQQHADFFTTDTGWPSVVMQQCHEHDSGSSKAEKTDLGDTDLTHLLVLETMVMVKDETIGDLEISKKVTNDSSDKKFEDKEFEFSVKLYETVKNGDGTESKKPVSGDFACLIKSSGADDKERTVTFDADGKAALTLKTGQSILIKDLPASAEYEVKEKAADYWTVSSSKDGEEYKDGKTVKGMIPEPADDGSKQKSIAAYNNTYSPEAARLSIPVEKKFNAWKDKAFKDAYFDIRLTAIGNKGSGDVNTTMPEGSVHDSEGRMTATERISEHGSEADSKGYVSGTGSFKDLTFTNAGTYIYTVKEIIGDESSISYSKAVYDVVVTVTDDENGRLSASSEITAELDDNGTAIPSADRKPQDKATFINTYKDNHGYMDIRIHKTYENETGSDAMTHDQFRFKLQAVGENASKAPLPGNPDDRGDDSVTVGNTIGGSVSFPTITFGTDDADNAYVYKLTEVMPKGASEDNDYTVDGTKYDPNEFFVRITVTANGEAALKTSIEYFEDEECTWPITKDNQDTSDYLYEIEPGVYRLWFNNSYSAAPVSAVIKGSKTLEGRDMKADEFSFSLEAADNATKAALADDSVYFVQDGTDADKALTSLEANAEAADEGEAAAFTFGRQKTESAGAASITFNKAGTYRFRVKENIPADAKDNVKNGITYDENISTVTVTVTDKDDDGNKTGRLKAQVSYENSSNDETGLAKFVNKYKESGSYDITGVKTIEGRAFAEGDSFTFAITPDGSAPYPVDENDKEVKEVTIKPSSGNSADLDFGKVKFSKAGVTYKYTLREKIPADADNNVKDGVTYDTTSYELTLTSSASDPRDGKLAISSSLKAKAGGADAVNADTVSWTNSYSSTGALKLEGTKTLRGRDWKEGDSFTFTLWAAADNEELLAAVPDDSYDVEGDKAVFGVVTADYENAEGQQTVTLDFGPIRFTKDSAGEPYEFFITETVPGRSEVKGIVYDSEPHRIPVYVTDDGKGSLAAEVAKDSITNLDFYNTYSSSVIYSDQAGIVITKTLDGRDMEDGQFTFIVKALDNEDGNTTADDAAYKLGFGREQTEKEFKSTAALDGQSCTIDVLDGTAVKFTQNDGGKTFSYEVSEQNDGKPGYSYDGHTYRVDIKVTDDGEGVLSAQTTVKDKATGKQIDRTSVSSRAAGDRKIAKVPFANTYEASGEMNGDGAVKIEAQKTLTGRDMKDGEFRFRITNAEDKAEQKTVIAEGTSAAAEAGKAGAVEFGKITYTTKQLKKDVADGLAVKKGGKYVYQYLVSEVTDKLPAGVSPVKSSFSILVTVSDNGDSTLKMEVTYPDGSDKLAFENEYDTSEVSIPVTGLKLLENEHEGLALTPADIAGRFTFKLTGVETTQGVVESAAPVPVLDGREMTEAVNGVTGEIDFGRIVLQASDFEGIEPDDDGMRTRTFRYTITESGSFAGVTNDSNVSMDVNVTVKYSDSEKRFYVEDINEEEAFSFVNTYGIEDKTVDISTLFRVDKILTGRDLREGEFRFELLEMKDGEQSVIATGTNAAAEAGKAGIVDFGQITYSEPGEHDYVIREVVPAGGRDANTIFDTAGHSVHVSVKDNKDGTLSVTSSASDDEPIVFTNKQVKKEDPSKGGDPGANGGSHTNTGDRTPVGMIIAIMIAALCIIAAVVIVSRRKSRK